MNTNKIDLIKAEVERLQNELIQEKEKGFGSDTDDACILELQNVLTYIDSLQEEPVSEKKCMFTKDSYTDVDMKVLCEGCEEECEYVKKEGASIVISLNGQRHRQVWHNGSFSKKECKEECSLYDRCQRCCINLCMIFFHDPHCHFIEEPVSEELEEAAWIYYDKNKPLMPQELALHREFVSFFKAGAKWKEEQFEKNRLKHCNSITNEQAELEQGFIDQHLDKNKRMPTFIDAIEYGMKLMKEQMMKSAVDGEIGECYPTTIHLDKDIPELKHFDKVKMIIIKEEQV